jgi:hypothetical protein
MTHSHLRRRLSFALPAFVFLSFTLAETVEVRAVTQALISLSLADEQPAQVESRTGDGLQVNTCRPMRKGANEA